MTDTGSSARRAVGLLLGAAAGDALGWPNELRGGIVGGQKARDALEPTDGFIRWTRNGGSRFRGVYRDIVQPGEYSDDTQLLLATARSCLSGRQWLSRLYDVELPTWTLYQRGGGRAVLSAARSWANRTPPWLESDTSRSREQVARYRNAGANGVAMRIAPHVIYARRTGESFASRVLLDGLTTHGHPRALVGALVYASAVSTALASTSGLDYGALSYGARDGLVPGSEVIEMLPSRWGSAAALRDFEATWNRTNLEVEQLLELTEKSLKQGALSQSERTLIEIGCTDPKINGSGTITAVGAIYLASRSAARPMSGLLTAAFLRGGDTDTLASMTGALLGAIHGPGFLGRLQEVQDTHYLHRVGSALATSELEWSWSAPTGRASDLSTALTRRLSSDEVPPSGEFPDGRIFRTESRERLSGSTPATRYRLTLEDGQSVVVDIIDSQDNRERATAQSPTRDTITETSAATKEKRKADSKSRWFVDSNIFAKLNMPSGVAVGSVNFDACVNFYENALSCDLEKTHDWARVTPWLLIIAVTESQLDREDGRQMRLVLPVADLELTASRLKNSASFERDGDALVGRDPDGRAVVLVKA